MPTYVGMSTGVVMGIDRIDIATRLIEERGRTGYSQADFARQLDISREGLRLYEMGQRAISAEFIAKSAALGVDVQYVLTGIRSKNLEEATKANTPEQSISVNSGSSANVVQFAQSGANIKFGDTVHTQKHTTKVTAEVKPCVDHISETQAAALHRLVKEVVDLESKYRQNPASFKSVWAALNSHCGVTRYRLIPNNYYDKAEKYLRQWIGRLSSQKRAIGDDETRKRKYAYIKINTQSDSAWLATYLNRFNATSLTELDDEQLLKTYRAVAARKRK